MKTKSRYAVILVYEILQLFFLLFYSAGTGNPQSAAWYASSPLLIMPLLLSWMRIVFIAKEELQILVSKLFGITKLVQAIGLAGWFIVHITQPALFAVSYSVFFVILLLLFIVFNGILSVRALKANGEICK